MDQYDKIGDKYLEAKKAHQKKRSEAGGQIFDLLPKNLDDKKLLDVGCGDGGDLMLLKKRGGSLFGIDSSSHMVKLAKEKCGIEANISKQNMEKMCFDDNYFDFVISKYAIHYSKNVNNPIQEIKRVLKPGGTALLAVVHPVITGLIGGASNYHNRIKVRVPMYGGRVYAEYWHHNFEEYFSEKTLTGFELIGAKCGKRFGDIARSYGTKESYPDYLLLKLRKK